MSPRLQKDAGGDGTPRLTSIAQTMVPKNIPQHREGDAPAEPYIRDRQEPLPPGIGKSLGEGDAPAEPYIQDRQEPLPPGIGEPQPNRAGKSLPDNSFLVAGLLIALWIEGVSLADRPSLPQWKNRRSALERVHVVDEFRVFYTLQGDDALPDYEDENGNSIPDRIENLALQLTTARDVYVEVFKLRHPLNSPRYREEAKFIDVNVGSLPLSTIFNPEKVKGNGSAGDAVVNYHRGFDDPSGGVGVLTIDISKRLSTENLSPAHELFHLFQYGYTAFKNAWFLEGTARWIESAFRKGGGTPEMLPLTPEDQTKLFTMSYNAGGFWNKLARPDDSQGKLELPVELQNRSYIGRNKPIIEDAMFYGASLIKPLLEAMDDADDRANQGSEIGVDEWPESRQRSSDNNPFLWSAILQAANEYAPHSISLRSMKQELPAIEGDRFRIKQRRQTNR